MPISGGENEFGKHAFARWLEMGCADIWQPHPVDGYITLSDAPGLGLELDWDALKRFEWKG